MKILHTADLHMDSAFCGSGESYSHMRRERQREILKKIFRLAGSQNCDMMLIAGDFFDTSYVTPETKELCLSLFQGFEKPIIVSAGNHDPLVDGSFWKGALPKNVYVFETPSLSYFEFPHMGVAVGGYSFTSAALNSNPLEVAPVRQRTWERFIFLCAHADVDSPTSRYAPILSSDIRRLNFDYAALGHVHNTPDVTDAKIRYCGFAEGRSFDEIGDGGVLIVEASDDGISVTRHIISEYKYLYEELDVSDMCTAEQITDAINNRLSQIDRSGMTFLRLEICGVVTAESIPDLRALEGIERDGIRELQLIDSTLCLPDKSFLEKDTSLRGEFYRSLRSQLYSEDISLRRTALRALRIGLAAIDGRDFTQGGTV